MRDQYIDVGVWRRKNSHGGNRDERYNNYISRREGSSAEKYSYYKKYGFKNEKVS